MGAGWIWGWGGYACLYCGASFSSVYSPYGVEVVNIVPTGAFGVAGIAAGDYITSVCGQPVGTLDDLIYMVENCGEGQPVEVVVYSASTGGYYTVYVTF